jgi:hypothetical protein
METRAAVALIACAADAASAKARAVSPVIAGSPSGIRHEVALLRAHVDHATAALTPATRARVRALLPSGRSDRVTQSSQLADDAVVHEVQERYRDGGSAGASWVVSEDGIAGNIEGYRARLQRRGSGHVHLFADAAA